MDDLVITNNVVEILKNRKSPLTAQELVRELAARGLIIEKHKLNQILWSEIRNSRYQEMCVDNNFRWSLVSKNNELGTVKQMDSFKEQQMVELWKTLDFIFLGTRRKGTKNWFFYICEVGDEFRIIGPTGNILKELKSNCTQPEECEPSFFTSEQIAVAVREVASLRERETKQKHLEIYSLILNGESIRNEVYIGPRSIRVENHIPLDAVIQIAPVTRFDTLTVNFGPGVVFQPFYLVVDVIGMGQEKDRRYGVFQFCIYELIKDGYVRQKGGDLSFDLNYLAGKIYLVGSTSKLELS